MDATDWVKLGGYAAGALALVVAARGDKAAAADLRAMSALCGGFGVLVDLAEAPKHCGRRSVFQPQLQNYRCTVCGSQLRWRPQLGFE